MRGLIDIHQNRAHGGGSVRIAAVDTMLRGHNHVPSTAADRQSGVSVELTGLMFIEAMLVIEDLISPPQRGVALGMLDI